MFNSFSCSEFISAHALLFQVFLFLLHCLKHDLVLYFPSLCHPGASSAVNIYISLHSRLKIWALWKLQTHSFSSVMSSVSWSVGSECIYEWNDDPLITLFTDFVALCSLVGDLNSITLNPHEKRKKTQHGEWHIPLKHHHHHHEPAEMPQSSQQWYSLLIFCHNHTIWADLWCWDSFPDVMPAEA